jgi:hypothetical protein
MEPRIGSTMNLKEIDKKVRDAYDTGYLEGVLVAKDANAGTIDKMRWDLSECLLLSQ